MIISLDLTKLITYKTFEENLEIVCNKIKENNNFIINSIDQLLILNSLLLISSANENTISENNKQYYFKQLKDAELYYKDKKCFKSENQFIINELQIDVNKYSDFSYAAWNDSVNNSLENIEIDWSEINEN